MWRTWSLYFWSGLFSAALPSLVMILTMTHPHIRAYLSRLFICCNTFEAWFWWGWWWVGGGLLPGRDFLVTSCWDRKWGRGVRRLAGAGCFYPYNHQSTYCTTCNAEILLFGSESITICMRYLWMEKYLCTYFPSSSPNTIHCRCPLSSRPIGPNMESDPEKEISWSQNKVKSNVRINPRWKYLKLSQAMVGQWVERAFQVPLSCIHRSLQCSLEPPYLQFAWSSPWHMAIILCLIFCHFLLRCAALPQESGSRVDGQAFPDDVLELLHRTLPLALPWDRAWLRSLQVVHPSW